MSDAKDTQKHEIIRFAKLVVVVASPAGLTILLALALRELLPPVATDRRT